MDIGLTKQEKDSVRTSWGKYMNNAMANGTGFYLSMFKTYPAIFASFKELFKDAGINELNNTPKMKAQVKVFNDAIGSFVDNLDDTDCLTVLVQKMAKNHFSRGIKIKEFHDAYGLFVRFLQDTLHLDGPTKDSWEKTVAVICKIMDDYMKQLS